MATAFKASATTEVPLGHKLVIAGDRPAEVVNFERQVVDFFVSAADLLGVPKSVASIYGIVFASPVPLSFAEIEARLDISKGSVSQGLRVLREVGAIKPADGGRTTEDGGRTTADGRRRMAYGGSDAKEETEVLEAGGSKSAAKRGEEESGNGSRSPFLTRRGDAYVPDLELRKLVGRFIENRLEKQLAVGSTKLTALTRTVPGRGSEATELKKRLQSLSDWHSKAKTLLPVVRTVLKISG